MMDACDIEAMFGSLDQMQKGLDSVLKALDEQVQANSHQEDLISSLNSESDRKENEVAVLRQEDQFNRTIKLEEVKVQNEAMATQRLHLIEQTNKQTAELAKMKEANDSLDESFVFGEYVFCGIHPKRVLLLR